MTEVGIASAARYGHSMLRPNCLAPFAAVVSDGPRPLADLFMS